MLFLAEELARRRKAPLIELVGDRSPIHSWIHLHDLELSGRRKWLGIILHETLALEELLR